MQLTIRKIVTYKETILVEGGRDAPEPLDIFAAAAVVRNPWAGRGFVEDLSPEIQAFGPILGQRLTDEMLKMAGGGDAIEAFGKAAMSGTDCELEHASALDPHAALRQFLPAGGVRQKLPWLYQYAWAGQHPDQHSVDGQK